MAFVNERYNILLSAIVKTQYDNSPEDASVEGNNLQSIKTLPTDVTIVGQSLSAADELPDIDDAIKFLDANRVNVIGTMDKHATLTAVVTLATTSAKLYCHSLKRLLDSVLNLRSSISYWESLKHSRWNQSYYVLQTLPIYIRHLVTTAASSRSITMNQLPQLGLQLYNRIISHPLQREIHRHMNILQHDQQVLASWLGGLADLPNKEELASLADIQRMASTLHCAASVMQAIDRTDEVDKQTAFDARLIAADDDSTDVETIVIKLMEVYQMLIHIDTKLPRLMARHGPPTRLVQDWPLAVAGLYTFNSIARHLTLSNYHLLVESSQDAINTLRAFGIDWIFQPLAGIYKTIRHREPQLAALGSKALETDMESLSRMVSDFAQDHSVLQDDIPKLVEQARLGDISIVLQRYEDAIRHPVRGAVTGGLVRSLLIQVQQAKVQLEVAMSALDKLLKSNELNFAFLAVIPSLLISYFVGSYINDLVNGRQLRSWKQTRTLLHRNLRNIERILNTADASNTHLRPEAQGMLLVHMTELRKLASSVPRRDGLRLSFVEDVRDVENGGFSITQRLRTVERMWRMYS
ncbi:hypothetical protein SmJEL517_g02199 [Synchytrium microbalum]|uniref:Nuclear control of ATPase protein 2 n=1 Tax=Synchytrium microbalum TaxID=1806994 RepID=A0A507C7L4_9FUNG|nr:uncharacterized protein SmJEL517_g02199 [Synchytrium microbalum]TPX35318.1 hypothetical protein SmJEL517_g02199 [Synchytrium microbalum]